jgi:hypothetical protein
MSKTNTDERRRLARWKATYFFRKDNTYDKKHFDVIDKNRKESIGHLVDLNLTGMKIIGRRLIERNVIYDLRIDLPREVKGVHEIFAKAQCVWSEKDINPEFFLAGFKILSITPPFSEIIETLIED